MVSLRFIFLQLLYYSTCNIYHPFSFHQDQAEIFSKLHAFRRNSPALISHRLPSFFPKHGHYHEFGRVNLKPRTTNHQDSHQEIDSYEYYN